jgi:hypothetical protein
MMQQMAAQAPRLPYQQLRQPQHLSPPKQGAARSKKLRKRID